MSYFSGTHNLVMLMSALTFFVLFLQAALMAAGAVEGEEYLLNNHNQLLYSNREEMVQIAGYGDEKLSTVLVTGSVVCEACLHGDGEPHLRQWPIPGARVVVHCHHAKKSSKSTSWTDEFGDFLVDLPSHLHAIPNLDKACSLKVVRLPNNSICRPTPNYYFKRHHYSLTLSSVGNGIRAYNAGYIKLLHGTSKPSPPCINKHVVN
ncbi:hypothetical protein HS088_TW21G00989 [Tripterygium wilfordii]|uniref:Pollen Ole e 1 allergen and extensin family protein n=1 Tax=Tripterygium wilfordii TaxID=458696 RepID=A0A7J7C4G7_TRIWF|nr:uncharacterized protein LOC119990027 [Tripterygium wilfordii]KAF5728835.1 hypothetical protein HS088_TW21G00989 [Tripterygium wilfordii]